MGMMKREIMSVIEHIVYEVNDSGYLEECRAAYLPKFRGGIAYKLAKALITQIAAEIEPDSAKLCYVSVVENWPELIAEELAHAEPM